MRARKGEVAAPPRVSPTTQDTVAASSTSTNLYSGSSAGHGGSQQMAATDAGNRQVSYLGFSQLAALRTATATPSVAVGPMMSVGTASADAKTAPWPYYQMAAWQGREEERDDYGYPPAASTLPQPSFYDQGEGAHQGGQPIGDSRHGQWPYWQSEDLPTHSVAKTHSQSHAIASWRGAAKGLDSMGRSGAYTGYRNSSSVAGGAGGAGQDAASADFQYVQEQLYEELAKHASAMRMPDSADATAAYELLQANMVTIKNMPYRCTKFELLQVVTSFGFAGTYVFFCLPLRRNEKQNHGFACISFVDQATMITFCEAMDGYRFTSRNSTKVVSVTPNSSLEDALRSFWSRGHTDSTFQPTAKAVAGAANAAPVCGLGPCQ
eukprot:TRINITY_DN5607_c0_g1_i3.p1 TRINITY_DN5607_c0_g1~~TRINITY_DN5607_c0_g1_i3.p1  ORF type:complete len:379 (-),score=45.92 TRINITY_DN5607_c0_g1_i3:442-1578(-)